MQRIALALTGLLALAACGGDDGASVSDAWSRSNPLTETPGVVYFDLTVAEDDRLIAASVPASVAARAEIHEVLPTEMDMDDTEMSDDMDDMEMSEGSDDMGSDEGHDMEGMMTMREMSDGLALEGGDTVSFEPGGYHVMLMDLVDPLEPGDEFELTLDFENADSVDVTVEVSDSAP